ncbi:MAG: hypothetical protein ABW215_09395 [Kibdelosporangium sp.]
MSGREMGFAHAPEGAEAAAGPRVAPMAGLSNSAMTRAFSGAVAMPPMLRAQLTPVQREAEVVDTDAAQRKADAVYDALDGWDDEDEAIAALVNTGPGMRDAIAQKFADSHDESLDGYLRDQLSGQDLVRATALRHSTNLHEPHTQIALCMFGAGTRDGELMRVLESLPLSGRQELKKRYDEAFGPIGDGSLEADLKDDLSGWALEKSLVMLIRDLTDADHLYFNGVAITGTHTDSVIAAIQNAWAGGVEKMRALETGWNDGVRGQRNGSDEVWTYMDLRAALVDELSGEALALVLAVWDQYARLGNPADPVALEEARLNVARETLRAAGAGPGTTEEQVFRAITEIRTVWEARLQRVAGTPQEVQYRQDWEKERAALLAAAPEEMDTDSADYKRVRLLLAGALTVADEIYLAKEELDTDKVVNLVTKAWVEGKIGELLTLAATERRDGAGQVVRRSFDVQMTVPITSGMPWRRIATLTRDDLDDAHRGANRLHLELQDDDSDGALRMAYNLVKDTSASLRYATISAYTEMHLAQVEGDTPTRKFLTHIQQRYENSYTCYDFQDMMDPAGSAKERLERARGRMAASHTGWFDFALTGITNAYDALTGEQSEQVAEESLDRLAYIAQHEGINDTELDAMCAMTGKSKAELSAMEYAAFKVRLEELRSLRQSIVDAMATALELVVQVAITVATGGAAAGMLVASLSAALAGMVMREALQGKDYEFTSDENAQRLIIEIAAGSMGAFGGVLAEGIGEAHHLAQLGKTQFMRAALQEGFQAVGRATAESMFTNRMPSAEDIGARALTIVGSMAGAGAGRVLSHGAADLPTLAQQVRRNVSGSMTQNLISGTTEEGANLVRTGFGDQTGVDLAGKFARRGAQSLATGLVSGIGDTIAARSARPDGDAEIQQLPDASVISGGEKPFSAAEADTVYANCRKETPGREAAVLENTATGERVVVQGHETLAFGEGSDFQSVWREFTAANPGATWKLVAHSHAVDATTGVTPLSQRFPSGRGGDFSVAAGEAAATGHKVEHSIDIIVEGGKNEKVRYGYDPGTEQPFWVEVPDGNGGKTPERFKSYEAYHEWYQRRFGQSPEVEGGAGPAAPARRPVTETETEARDRLANLRERVNSLRNAHPDDEATQALCRYLTEELDSAREVLGRANRQTPPEALPIDTLDNVADALAGHQRALAPVPPAKVQGLVRRLNTELADCRRDLEQTRQKLAAETDAGQRKQLERKIAQLEQTRGELEQLAPEAANLETRLQANPELDARMEYDNLRRRANRASREDYVIDIRLTDPVTRAEVIDYFSQATKRLENYPGGETLRAKFMQMLTAADGVTLTQSPRQAGAAVASTNRMRQAVLEGIRTGKYPPEYVAAFEAARVGSQDGWPRTPQGTAWEVDHVMELWTGGADDGSNYLAIDPRLHEIKSSILTDFRAKFRNRLQDPGGQSDSRSSGPLTGD